MKALIQRTTEASVTVGGKTISRIGHGLLVLLGIGHNDGEREIEYLCSKIVALRVFDDSQGVMNCSVKETGGEILVVSQFTLMANTKKGNRPSYILAAKGDLSKPLYEKCCCALSEMLGKPVARGIFGAEMKVALINDGPVTLMIDTDENLLHKKEQQPLLQHQQKEYTMTIKAYQEKVDEWIQTFGVRYFDIMTNMAILAEETGEVARVVAREWGEQSRKPGDIVPQTHNESPEARRKRLLADELADLFWVTTCIANQTGIDLESALQQNFEKKTDRDKERHQANKKLNSPLSR